MVKIYPEMKALECSQHYSHYRSMDIFFRRSRAANSIDPFPIVLNFKPIKAFMLSLLPARTNKINQKLRCSSALNIIHSFFKRLRAAKSVVGDGIWQKFELIRALIDVLVTCKNYKDSSKTESIRVLTKFLPL